MPLVIAASRFDFPQLGFELTFQLGHSRSWKGQRDLLSLFVPLCFMNIVDFERLL